MEIFKLKKTLENGLTNSLNSNISVTKKDIDIYLFHLKENNLIRTKVFNFSLYLESVKMG